MTQCPRERASGRLAPALRDGDRRGARLRRRTRGPLSRVRLPGGGPRSSGLHRAQHRREAPIRRDPPLGRRAARARASRSTESTRELLRELAPTHVVTQVQCEVCAVSLEEVEAALTEWAGRRPALVALNPASLEDVFADIARVAAALETPERGERLVGAMRARMTAIAATASAAQALSPPPRVATIEWLSPLMTAGNWMPELIAMAGGTDVLGVAGAHSRWIEWEELSRRRSGRPARLPLRFFARARRARDRAPHGAARLGRAARRPGRPRLSRRIQPVFQPARAPARSRRSRSSPRSFILRRLRSGTKVRAG